MHKAHYKNLKEQTNKLNGLKFLCLFRLKARPYGMISKCSCELPHKMTEEIYKNTPCNCIQCDYKSTLMALDPLLLKSLSISHYCLLHNTNRSCKTHIYRNHNCITKDHTSGL